MSEPTTLNLDLAADEDAVVMTVDENGELDWVFPDGSRASDGGKRAGRRAPKRASKAGVPRTVHFEIAVTVEVAPRKGASGRRNLFKKVLKGVAGWVFKFVRQKVTGLLIRHLEKGVRKGLVRVNSNVPSEWSPQGEKFVLPKIQPSAGKPLRVLLLVHGTFSSTVGSFGGLAFSVPGLSLINALQQQYDHVIGWDHYTLSDTPAENAAEILAALDRAFPKGGPKVEIDAIAFSRGGLVLRTLLEQQVRGHRLELAFQRSVFVACTLGGTKLAQRAHWKHFITIMSNVAVAACRGVATAIPPAAVAAVWVETVARGVAALVRFLATSLIDDEAVPGLAAMDPDQQVVKDINAAAPPARLLAAYRAVTNDFEPNGPGAAEASEAMPSGLKLKLWDLVADAQMRQANDLVVHTSSMRTVASGLLPDDQVLALPQNGRTMHTTCFRDATVIGRLRGWLIDRDDVGPDGSLTRRGINRRLRQGRRVKSGGVAVAASSTEGAKKSGELGELAVLHTGDKPVKLGASRAVMRRLADEWSYTLRQRSRWAHDEDHRSALGEYAVDTLLQLGLTDERVRDLAQATRIQVELSDPPTSAAAHAAIAASEFPWEYVLSAATRARGRVHPMLITRLLRHPKRSPRLGAGKGELTIITSAPGRIGDHYSFDSEVSRLGHAVQAESEEGLVFPPKGDLPHPTLEQVRAHIRAKTSRRKNGNPLFVHVTGVDPNQAAELVPGFLDELPHASSEGVVLAGKKAREEIVDAAALGSAIVPEGSPPTLVTLNLHYSAAHTAREMLRGGAYASLGFMDTIPDDVAEYFFTVFYAECHKERSFRGIPHAFQRTWTQLVDQGYDLHGTCVVLWLSELVTDAESVEPAHPAKLSKAVARPAGRMADTFAVDVEVAPEINYSLLHNQRSVLSRFTLSKLVPDRLDDVRVEVELDAGDMKQVFRRTYTIDEPHVALAEDVKLPLTSSLLRSLRERLQTTLYTRVTWEGRVVHEDTRHVALLPVDEWYDDTRNNPWLPSFVLPRDPAVAQIISEARKYLVALTDDPDAGFDGYQGVDADADPASAGITDLQVRAIWTALINDRDLLYINPPPAYSHSGQRLRTPSEVLATSSGTCIDLSLLLAACLEYVDIHSCLVLLSGHCFVGYWRAEEYQTAFTTVSGVPEGDMPSVAEMAARSPIGLVDRYGWRLGPQCFDEIHEHLRKDELRMLEATGLCFNYSFERALEEGLENMNDRSTFDSLLDVRLARRSSPPVTPLPILRDDG